MVTDWDIVLETMGDPDKKSVQTALPSNRKRATYLKDKVYGDNGPQKGFRASTLGIQKLEHLTIKGKDSHCAPSKCSEIVVQDSEPPTLPSIKQLFTIY